jgi:hypothetical protein
MVATVRSAWNEAATEQLKQQRREGEPHEASDAMPPPAPASEVAAHGGWTA